CNELSFCFQAEDGIRDRNVTGVQTCALPICHIVTNAHVVKGESHVGISTNDGQEYNAKVIGYSNKIDVAVLSVEALAGQSPLPRSEERRVGKECRSRRAETWNSK